MISQCRVRRVTVLLPLFSMQLYDRAADPGEFEPLRPSRWMGQRFSAFLSDMQRAELEIWNNVTGGEEPTVTLDPDTIDELKALGYLE